MAKNSRHRPDGLAHGYAWHVLFISQDFSSRKCGGIKPIASHIRYIPDFCYWNGKVVLATDEASIQGNPLVGQPQSNLWFGDFEELKSWGPEMQPVPST